LALHEYSPDRPLAIGGCTIGFTPTVHYISAYAMRIDAGAGVLGYSADTAPCDQVPELVRGADLFLCEAALGAGGKEDGRRGHLNAHEAGRMASAAGVQHLVLTHYSAKAHPDSMREAAAQAFSGKITVADDGMELGF
ncbi:MAG TPA: MBL fold metallo-hydrolase, partial [Candidatus Baltobacteraceae bacterium]|nr:MBL fold metallo-hydrolase [Candidatus Baltobacteraceae bacterium]